MKQKLENNQLSEEHLQKAYDYLNKAKDNLSLRFTGHKLTDMIIETGYNNLDNLKNVLTELYKENIEKNKDNK